MCHPAVDPSNLLPPPPRPCIVPIIQRSEVTCESCPVITPRYLLYPIYNAQYNIHTVHCLLPVHAPSLSPAERLPLHAPSTGSLSTICLSATCMRQPHSCLRTISSICRPPVACVWIGEMSPLESLYGYLHVLTSPFTHQTKFSAACFNFSVCLLVS